MSSKGEMSIAPDRRWADNEHLLKSWPRGGAGPGMRSGCDPAIPARIGPRERRASPDLSISTSRIVPDVLAAPV
jgi:hypothetical protein